MGALTHRTALVTGASGGIGAAIALALAEEGTHLLLSGRNPERLTAVAERATALLAHVDTEPADLAEDTAVQALAERTGAIFERLDLLIHSIGLFHGGPVATSPIDQLDAQLRINLRVPYLLTQLLLPALKKSQGQILFVNSTAGLVAKGNWGAYAASKHALKALADSLREEVNGDGVRVVTVFPGRTASAMQEQVKELEGKPYDPNLLLQPADVAAMVVAALKLPRTAEVTNLQLRPMAG